MPESGTLHSKSTEQIDALASQLQGPIAQDGMLTLTPLDRERLLRLVGQVRHAEDRHALRRTEMERELLAHELRVQKLRQQLASEQEAEADAKARLEVAIKAYAKVYGVPAAEIGFDDMTGRVYRSGNPVAYAPAAATRESIEDKASSMEAPETSLQNGAEPGASLQATSHTC